METATGDAPPAEFLGPDVLLAAAPIDDHVLSLMPEEKEAVAHAVQKRQRQFATGRHLAHRLLALLDVPRAPLVPDDDRAPVWPEGIVGSIAHCDELAVVAVARNTTCRAIGLDVEGRTPLGAELWSSVLTGAERDWLGRQPDAEQGELAKVVFCAKECAYKAQYPLSGEMLDFHEVTMQLGDDGTTFRADMPAHIAERIGLESLTGNLHRGPTTVIAGAALPA